MSARDVDVAEVHAKLLAAELAPSVGLRNVLTHEYVEVQLDVVASSIAPALDGYGRYVTEVARFLTESRRGDSNP